MLFWLLTYLTLRDGLLDPRVWSIRTTYLLACYFAVRAIVLHFGRHSARTPSAQHVITQIRMPSASSSMHEHGGIWTRADYDAWLLAQRGAWLVIYNDERVSTSEETEPTTGPFPAI